MFSLLDNLSIEQLNKILTFSKWFLGIVAVLTTIAALFNLYLGEKIALLQRNEKEKNQERLVQAETAASRAKDEALSANLRAEEIEKKIAPRSLTMHQSQLLEAALTAMVKSGKAYAGIVVASAMFDTESERLGESIFRIIQKAKWESKWERTGAATFTGIRIVTYDEQVQAASEAVQQAFRNAKIDFSADSVPLNQCGYQVPTAVYIWVGKK